MLVTMRLVSWSYLMRIWNQEQSVSLFIAVLATQFRVHGISPRNLGLLFERLWRSISVKRLINDISIIISTKIMRFDTSTTFQFLFYFDTLYGIIRRISSVGTLSVQIKFKTECNTSFGESNDWTQLKTFFVWQAKDSNKNDCHRRHIHINVT